MLHYQLSSKILHFKQAAGTSRGTYHTRLSHYIQLTDPTNGHTGIGECAPLPDLGCDRLPNYTDLLAQICTQYCQTGIIPYEQLRPYPSILFGLETAHLHLHRQSLALFDSPFSRGQQGIRINGLIWMGPFHQMEQRIRQKLADGFHCIKLKIGAIQWEDELHLIRLIRQQFSATDIQIRVDANGAFTKENALQRLEQLSRYDLHSIEQPIAADYDNWATMQRLCQESPLPIAFDEQLIGINQPREKEALLRELRPQYIVLKPTLHGGMHGTREWIQLADQLHISSWITSALESNIGLNALAHFTAHTYGPHLHLPQGLGTGQLFTDNIPSPLHIKGEQLWYSPNF